jgi:rRNA-processing protein FCF1
MSSENYIVIIDTNIVFRKYDERADFSKFSFSKSFDLLISKIQELDIYENVSIGIPIIVWHEMKEQFVKSYKEKLREIARIKKNYTIPFCNIFFEEGDYITYANNEINKYKDSFKESLVNIVELEFPSNNRFSSIIQRSLQKKQPFEGVDNISDKGFKDALIWESIIEFKQNNPEINVILFTDDKKFGEELKEEYRMMFNQEIDIVYKNNNGAMVKQLENVSQKLNKERLVKDIVKGDYEIEDWLYSEEFKQQVIEYEPQFIENSSNIMLKDIVIWDIGNKISKGDIVQVDIVILAKFDVDKTELEKKFNVSLLAELAEGAYSIQDLFVEGEHDE